MDAATAYNEIKSRGHEYGPLVQTYKAELGETRVTVFNRRGRPVEVHARDIVHHIDGGGMSLTEEAAYAANPKTDEAKKWASEQPNPTPSIINPDNAEAVPTFRETKAVIADWLTRHGIEHDNDATKADLLELARGAAPQPA